MTLTPGISARNGPRVVHSHGVPGVSLPLDDNPNQSAVSWAAIFAGATAAAAIPLMLLVLDAV